MPPKRQSHRIASTVADFKIKPVNFMLMFFCSAADEYDVSARWQFFGKSIDYGSVRHEQYIVF
ncbi:hypothetical protein MTBBW1_1310010 [Desulfamplus magnetovallimortis]|uniref:Uncharacterized protein n=1 Tax=Desulfamplus magnetovallimortis TaxID=1246637 RepID=A0A1W1H757_9BACT|nr:hypothetical protein MTBBW1_1310010 [Desulfamplus magnetovallimortis]